MLLNGRSNILRQEMSFFMNYIFYPWVVPSPPCRSSSHTCIFLMPNSTKGHHTLLPTNSAGRSIVHLALGLDHPALGFSFPAVLLSLHVVIAPPHSRHSSGFHVNGLLQSLLGCFLIMWPKNFFLLSQMSSLRFFCLSHVQDFFQKVIEGFRGKRAYMVYRFLGDIRPFCTKSFNSVQPAYLSISF